MIVATKPQLSVVVPIYNEQGSIRPLFARLFSVLDNLGSSFEVVAVDDGSNDATPAILGEETRRRDALRVLTLDRNCGQHAAICTGFEAARADWIVTLDADLQNPPEEIPRLVEALRAGHDFVGTIRRVRRDTRFRRVASRLNGVITRRVSGVNIGDFGSMLRGYHRTVIEPIVKRREPGAFVPVLGARYARNPTEIPVDHAVREQGQSKYSLWRLCRLHVDLIRTASASSAERSDLKEVDHPRSR